MPESYRRLYHDGCRSVAIASLLACFACASPPDELHLPTSALSLVAPDPAGAYRLVERRDSGSPTEGIAHRYASPEGENWTAYFYLPEPISPTPSPSGLLDLQVAVFKRMIAYQSETGAFDAYEVFAEAPDPIATDAGTIDGRMLAYVFRRGEVVFVSVLFLHAVRDGLVEIRGTVDAETWERSRPTFPRDFMRALIAKNSPL